VADIFQDLPIAAPRVRVFEAVATPAGLDRWWTLSATGVVAPGGLIHLSFGPMDGWEARVVVHQPDAVVEYELTRADADWTGTRVRCELEPRGRDTWLRFQHAGWASVNEHYRVSCHCWAMYLRLLRRWAEHGEVVPYEARLVV
jgi:uncharacterized protein YndB with AHSA1/START domain